MTSFLRRTALTAVTFLAVASATAGGCATSNDTQPTDATTATGSGGSNGGSTATSTSSGGGTGGSGGSTGSCAIDCGTIATPDCQTAVCNEGNYPGPVGQCVIIDEADGTTCDDGLFCTVSDSCTSGTCGGDPNDCSLTPSACEEVVCDETAQDCNLNALTDGTSCSNGDLCVSGETCSFGTCGGGAAVDCFFFPVPNECHVAVCNPMNGMCEAVPGNEFQPCTDQNDLCTVNKTCAGGVCVGGTPKNCSNLTQGCDLGVCDTTSGQCTTMAVMNGQTCDDLDACTNGEICTNGNCSGGTPVTACSLTADGCCPSNCTTLNDLDCQCMTHTLDTFATSSAGWDGIMFDITAVNTVIINGFATGIDPGTKTFEIYYKAGTHVGFETNAAAWTLAGSTVMNTSSASVATPIPINVNVQIPATQTYAFYVTSTAGTTSNGINYVTQTINTLQASDANIQLFGGTSKGSVFAGSTFVGRGFTGIIDYDKCGN